jgi:hypothetical protein
MRVMKQKTAEDLVLRDALGWCEFEAEGKTYIFQIAQDDDCPNPRRDRDHVWTWTTSSGASEYTDDRAVPLDVFEDMEKEERREYIMRPLYLYRHSGDIISTGNTHYPFNDRFDSGCMGAAYVLREDVKRDFGWKVLTKKRIKELEKILEGEVEEMNLRLSGDVYGFALTCLESSEHESCWGFYCADRWEIVDRAAEFLKDSMPITDGRCREIAEELVKRM